MAFDKDLIEMLGVLLKQAEQLRILKNFVELEEVYCKDQIKALIKAMEANNE